MSQNSSPNAVLGETSPATTPKSCFVITPIGGDGSTERRSTDGLLSSVLRPVLTPMGYETKAAHEIEISGSISKEIVRRLVNSTLVVANLTGLNPNVMYELAVRHAKRKPVIILALHGTLLPFDIVQERTIFFRDDLQGGEELKKKLEAAVKAIEAGAEEQDNPIYSVVEEDLIRAKASTGSVDTLLLDRLEGIERRLANLDRKRSSSGYTSSSAKGNSDSFPKRLRLSGTFTDNSNLIRDLSLPGITLEMWGENTATVGVADADAFARLVQASIQPPNQISGISSLD